MILTALKDAFLAASYKLNASQRGMSYRMRHLWGIHLRYAALSGISVPFCLIMTQTWWHHDALSPERAVIRLRIAAVLQLSTPVSSRDRCSARRSPNEQRTNANTLYLKPPALNEEQLPITHLEINICGGGCPYWQQAGAADHKRHWCAQPIQPGCQLRMASHWLRTFFSMFSCPGNIKKSKYRE